VVKVAASNWENGKEVMTFKSYRVRKAIPQVKKKKNQALCIMRLMTATGRLVIAASTFASAQSSYIGLSALVATCKGFCFQSSSASKLRFYY
jgi:hypothetical protein